MYNYNVFAKNNFKEGLTMKKNTLNTLSTAFVILSISALYLYTNWSAQPVAMDKSSLNSSDIQLMARCVNGEARAEPYIGQVAVAAVILNRINHPSFPNSLSGVIYQPGAFTATSDGQINVPIDPNSTVFKACREAMNGSDPSGGAIYYYNPAKTTNKWIWSRKVIKTIGKHKFAI